MDKRYAYSFNEENYHGEFESHEAALAEARADKPDSTVWIGEMSEADYKDFIPSADWLIDHMRDAACDGGPEVAESYLDHVEPDKLKAIEQELPQVIYDLFKKHGVELQPSYFSVDDIKEYKS